MTQKASPQAQPEIAWRVAFTCKKKQPTYPEMRADLMTACWNNGRMADFLYHFLLTGSRRAKGQHLDASATTFVIDETQEDIRKKTGISVPTQIAFLKIFAKAGYVQRVAKTSYEVNFQAVQQAFTNPPVKPNAKDNFSIALVSDEGNASEVEMLRQQIEKLTSQVQDFSIALVSLKSLYAQLEGLLKFHFSFPLDLSKSSEQASGEAADPFTLVSTLVSLKFTESSETASEAALSGQSEPPNLDKSNRDSEKRFRDSENSDCALASSPSRPFFFPEIEMSSEDYLEAQLFAYSQEDCTPPASQEESLPKGEGAQSDGYMQKTPVNEPEKPPKGNSRTRKPKAEQPALPLQVELGPLVMPDLQAPWNAGTAVAVSEFLRDKRYTPGQRENQINAANRMMRDFKHMTRAQFEAAFKDWALWWREHGQGFFTLADIMCKGKNNEVRLQSGLDRLEANANKPTQTPSQQKPKISPTSTPEVQQQWLKTLEQSRINTEQRLAAYRARKQAQQQVAN